MIGRIRRHFRMTRSLQQLQLALSRGAATAALRQIDPGLPNTWEFCGFSQNGEDGIIDYLSRRLLRPNRYFLEIGASEGVENNSAWLAVARKYGGLMIEGNPEASAWSQAIASLLNLPGLRCQSLFVDKDNAAEVLSCLAHKDPDVFSLDIDGNDYYVAKALLEAGLRPRICVVEYNAAFGPRRSVTIEYRKDFNANKAPGNGLYFGVSVSGWRTFFARHGYRFVTVDENGVNAFFADPAAFDPAFLSALKGGDFRDCVPLVTRFKAGWEKQFEEIRSLPLVDI